MKRYLVLYKGPPTPPDATHEGWPEWFDGIGDALVEVGSPMKDGVVLHPDGSTSDDATGLRGYCLIQAEEKREALELLGGHPLLRSGSGLSSCSRCRGSERSPSRRSREMTVNSISGITCYVEDLARSAEFYEAIGFRRGKEEPGRATFYVNWFFVTFVAQDQEADAELRQEAEQPAKGSGLYVYIKVDDVEDFHKAVVAAGMNPDGEPEKRPSGNREFVLRDPDGYKLVFFQKK